MTTEKEYNDELVNMIKEFNLKKERLKLLEDLFNNKSLTPEQIMFKVELIENEFIRLLKEKINIVNKESFYYLEDYPDGIYMDLQDLFNIISELAGVN